MASYSLEAADMDYPLAAVALARVPQLIISFNPADSRRGWVIRWNDGVTTAAATEPTNFLSALGKARELMVGRIQQELSAERQLDRMRRDAEFELNSDERKIVKNDNGSYTWILG